MEHLEDEILHYSQSAASPQDLRCPNDATLSRFTLQFKDDGGLIRHIKKTVRRVMEGAELGPCEPEKTLKRLQSGSETHEIQESN